MASKIQVRRDIAANWTAANPTLAQGEIGYETDSLNLKIGDGVTAWNLLGYVIPAAGSASVLTLQATNRTGSTLAKGAVVYINGAYGNKPTIALADADFETTSDRTIGLVYSSILDGNTGTVVIAGAFNGISTSGFSAGDILYVSSTPGTLTNVRPVQPAHAVIVGIALNAVGSGDIYINPEIGWEIEELHDVLISSIANNDVLKYESATGLWKNVTPTVLAGTIPHASLFGITTSDAGHTQFALLAGRSGGQVLNGSTLASENLTLSSTAHATKGSILFGTTARVYDALGSIGIGTDPSTVAGYQCALSYDLNAFSARTPTGGPLGIYQTGTLPTTNFSTSEVFYNYFGDVALNKTGGARNTTTLSNVRIITPTVTGSATATNRYALKCGAALFTETISVVGNATFDTTSLFVDSVNHRVGVGTITPAVPLDVVGAANISTSLNVNTNQLVVDSATGFTGIAKTTPAAKLNIDGSVTSAGWIAAAAGIGIVYDASTLTDTTSSGTIAATYIHRLSAPTIAASNSTTLTQVATLRVDAPLAGTNLTFTNPAYAAWFSGGNVRIDGFVGLGTVPAALFHISGTPSVPAWLINGIGLRFAAYTATDTTSSGTVAKVINHRIAAATFAASNTTTYTEAINLYIANAVAAGTNVTISNSYALYVEAGTSLFKGAVTGTSTLTWDTNTLYVDATNHRLGVGTTSPAVLADIRGVARIGDGTNYSDFESDGTLHFTGTATVWEDANVSALAARVGGTAPTFAAAINGIYGLRFDDGATAPEIHGSIEIPHSYKEGTDLVFHIHWSPTTTNTGNCRWGIEYSCANAGSAFPTSTTAYAVQAGSGTVNQNQLLDIVTISGTGRKISDIIAFRLFRDAPNAADTFTGNAFLWQIGIHFEKDTVGSRQITTK